ncbi:hypothetical protein K0M31_009197 [Melipona bicolor]|uniref:Uncharacterized protein n=1 Tax=Melipona bicolor TaxID=60889 RepID=A0AA40KJJ1_9HYME|nr:hypothetical protein K0M31_009197 [Melipona bicolor]
MKGNNEREEGFSRRPTVDVRYSSTVGRSQVAADGWAAVNVCRSTYPRSPGPNTFVG